jgi:hypothetical protein
LRSKVASLAKTGTAAKARTAAAANPKCFICSSIQLRGFNCASAVRYGVLLVVVPGLFYFLTWLSK